MFRRLMIVLVLSGILVFVLAWGAAAQGPKPGRQPEAAVTPEPVTPDEGGTAPRAHSAPTIAVGQPGLSYRYLQTFGTLETPYFDDSTHLNFPYGLATDGTNIWVAEAYGLRAMKYAASGLFGGQIGKAGYSRGADINQDLDFLADVAVDGSGNVWLVDASASHVLKFNSSGSYLSKLGQAYSTGTDNAHFNRPRGAAFDNTGNLFVSDTGNHRIQVFNSSSAYSTTLGISGVAGSDNTHFNNPRHIAIDGTNNLYIADTGNQRIQIFDADHAYLTTLGITGVPTSTNAGFNSPSGVFVDASKIYVADTNNHRVQIFDRNTRAYLATLGTGIAGSGNNQFNTPVAIVVDATGNIYVAENSKNARVQEFNSSLTYVRTYGTTGVPYVTDNFHFYRPIGTAVATDGSIYFVEERGQRLVKLNAAGAPQWVVGHPGIASGCCNDYFNSPNDVALDSAGRVYVADSGNNRIQIFNPDSTYYGTFGTGFGTGNYNFSFPRGLFIASDGTLYVADNANLRVQIYDSSRTFVATLGVTSVSGNDNAHFSSPWDVAVDGNGTIYVSDEYPNGRVQVFNSSRVYQRTIGGAAYCTGRNLFDEFCGPHQMAVDARNNLYLADSYNNRVQVFDSSGAYLTTIDGSFGDLNGQNRQPWGMAIDVVGNLYFADRHNHRVKKYSTGVPGWRQVNVNGFGDRQNNALVSVAPFGGQLYVGTNSTSGNGAQVWRAADGVHWSPVITNGFGITRNFGIDQLYEFNGQLYAGTSADNLQGAEILRSNDGTNWSPVVTGGFGDTTNTSVDHFAVFSNTLYVSAQSFVTHGFEIWRSTTGNSGDWTRVISNGFGIGPNNAGAFLTVYQGLLYAGVFNEPNGAQLWRSSDGLNWTQIISGGLGAANSSFASFAQFNGNLYLGTRNLTQGAQIWRSPDGLVWSPVASGGLGDTNSVRDYGLIVFGGKLYTYLLNAVTGVQVWRTDDGTTWVPVEKDGWGDSNSNGMTNYSKGVTIFNGNLYFGTSNSAQGGELWELLDKQLFLPAIRR
jgi:sugar lactone lactonase YvrE